MRRLSLAVSLAAAALALPVGHGVNVLSGPRDDGPFFGGNTRRGKGRNNRRGKGKVDRPKRRRNMLIVSKRVRRKHRRAA